MYNFRAVVQYVGCAGTGLAVGYIRVSRTVSLIYAFAVLILYEYLITLDAEIRRAGDQLWKDDERDPFDDGALVDVGTKDMRGGFLARGGGGGSPVYMGVGYVQGAEDRPRRVQRA